MREMSFLPVLCSLSAIFLYVIVCCCLHFIKVANGKLPIYVISLVIRELWLNPLGELPKHVDLYSFGNSFVVRK